MEVTRTELIKAVEQERIRHKLTQRAFGRFLGISESYYSMVKSGERQPNLTILTIFKQKLPRIKGYVDQYINYVTGDNHETTQGGETG